MVCDRLASCFSVIVATALQIALCAYTAVPGHADSLTEAAQALRHADGPAQQLSKPDRTILQATLALHFDHPMQGLQLLESASADGDPLIALLKAELHRQLAVDAIHKAETSSPPLQRPAMLLASADLSEGLGEADARLQSFVSTLDDQDLLPFDLLEPGNIANLFMVDKANSRLYLFAPDADGKWRKVDDEYVVTGAVSGDKQQRGDGKTPNGIYRFVRVLRGASLEARYGPVAFPIDYPNALDRLHGKDGDGIWLHGYATHVSRRPPKDTRGCFSLPNDRLLQLAKQIELQHSWVIIGEQLQFDHTKKKQQLRQSLMAALEQWRSDWASLNTEAYLAHYDVKFRNERGDLAAWKRYKRRVNATKSHIAVAIDHLTLIHDPNHWPEGEVVVAEFDQHYRSNNYQDVSRKRLYWVRRGANQGWKILIEESL